MAMRCVAPAQTPHSLPGSRCRPAPHAAARQQCQWGQRQGHSAAAAVATRAASTETAQVAGDSGSGGSGAPPPPPEDHSSAVVSGSRNLGAGGKWVAVLQASKTAALDVQESGRPLAEYMVLPASQYSVLDAKRIERLDADTFRCYVGGLKLFSLEVEPVITVSVTVQERGPTVRLLSTQLRGSKAVEAANERFDATMSNVVRWQEAPGGGGGLQIVSETFIQVQLVVPGWFVLPTASIERTGSAVMGRVLQTAVPRFLQQLAADYAAWAAGDESRQPVNSDGLLPEGGLQDAASGEEEEEQGWD